MEELTNISVKLSCCSCNVENNLGASALGMFFLKLAIFNSYSAPLLLSNLWTKYVRFFLPLDSALIFRSSTFFMVMGIKSSRLGRFPSSLFRCNCIVVEAADEVL